MVTDALEEDKVGRGGRGIRGWVAIVYRWSLMKWCLRLWRCQRRKLWLSEEDPLEEEMATHSSILAGKIPWTEETGGVWSMGLKRVGHDWVTEHACTPQATGRPCAMAWGCEWRTVLRTDQKFLSVHRDDMTEAWGELGEVVRDQVVLRLRSSKQDFKRWNDIIRYEFWQDDLAQYKE